jgi:tRNA(fMet)-specific endonuclease VapC
VRYLLDTNTCIRILNASSPALLARQRVTPASQVRLCSVVKAELWLGAEKSQRSAQIQQKLALFFARFRSMPFDDAAARAYASLRAGLEASGTPIGPNDMLIAATALANDLTMVTHNTAEFRRVPGLRLEDWELSSSP